MSTRSLAAWTALAALILTLGCESEPAEPQARATPVRTMHVRKTSLVERLTLAGRVVPPVGKDAILAPLVPGRISALRVRQGDRVKKGQLLAQVEPSAFNDAVAAAEASERRAISEMELKKREAERTKTLFEKGVASRQEMETDNAAAVAAESARTEAASGLAESRRRRDWSEIRAPFDGIVLRLLRNHGEQVDGTPATPVLEIAAESPTEVAGDATAPMLGRIQPGQDGEIVVPSSGTSAIPARIIQAARAVDPATGVGEVRLAPRRPSPALILGSSVEVRIVVATKQAVLVVPAAAVRRREDGATEVVVVDQGKAHAHPVVVGITEGDQLEISGVSEGDEVVVNDPNGLADGTALVTKP